MNTTYTITANDVTLGETFSKKSKAIEFASAHRDEFHVNVSVATQSGKIVFEQAAPKKIKMSKPYTRVVAVPEGVEVPTTRVCYRKSRKGLTVSHDMSKLGQDDAYSVTNDATGEVLATFATTRECGRFTVDFVAPANA